MSASQPSQQPKSKFLFLLLILLYAIRLVLILGQGYIHPDEHFQSPAITAHRLLRAQTHVAWEFQSRDTFGFDVQRSIVVPYMATGLPFLLLKSIFGAGNYIPANLMLLVPRGFVFLVSLLFDIILARNLKRFDASNVTESVGKANERTSSVGVLLALNLMWPVLLFHSRTFSNTWEALWIELLVAMCLAAASAKKSIRQTFLNMTVGAICGIGLFTRFTFPFFAWTFVAFVLLSKARAGLVRFLSTLFDICLGFAIVCSFCIVADTLYFATYQFRLQGQSLSSLVWIFAPFNNLLYNSKPSNLALHGTHPRWLHSLVNFPMLYGPLAIWFYVRLPLFLIGAWRSPSRGIILASVASILSGLAVLSMAPHQEARFLIPLSIPLAMLLNRTEQYVKGDLLLRLAFVFAILMSVFFGVFHQAGIARAIGSMQRHYLESSPSTKKLFVYYKTYMPPTYLANIPLGDRSIIVHDLAGASREKLLRELCDGTRPTIGNNAARQAFVVLPGPVLNGSVIKQEGTTIPVDETCRLTFEMSKAERFWPHISTENLPSSFTMDQLSLLMVPVTRL